jgi:ribonuclease VapC
VPSVVNLAEVVAHYARNGVAREQIVEVLAPLPIAYVPLDVTLAYDAGTLVPATRAAGPSLGDRACLALARRLAVPALTAERRWVEVAGAAAVAVEVRLIR